MAARVDQNQLAGHAGHILKVDGGKIKKLVKDPEATFYTTLASRNLPPVALEFIPKFYGVEETDGNMYIIIEDLTHGFDKVSMMDLKMGTTSVDPLLPKAKQEAMAKKDLATTTVSLGIRICGVRICDIDTGAVLKEGKPWGKKIKDNEMLDRLKLFLTDGKSLRKDIAAHYLERCRLLLTWQETNTSIQIISSSLFFVYDAAVTDSVKANLKMIDFAHVVDLADGKRDEHYLTGLRNLIKFLENIVA